MVPLKGFKNEETENKKPIQDFGRAMGKDRAVDPKASQYASVRRGPAKSPGPASPGRHPLCVANRLPMERPERNGYLFEQHRSLAISGMDAGQSGYRPLPSADCV